MVDVRTLELRIDATDQAGARLFAQQTETVARAAERAGRSVDRLDRGLDGVSASAARAGTAAGGAGTSLGTLGTTAAGAGAGINTAGVAAGRTTRRLTTLAGAARGAGTALRASFFGLGLGVALVAGTRQIATFEQSMLTLSAVAIRTTDTLGQQAIQYDSLARAARDAGATTRFTATESAGGLLELARAGLDANQAVAALPGTLNLAQVALLSVAEAADIATNVASQFGIEAENVDRILDGLTITANRSNTTVAQLAQGLIFAGPIAGQLGESLETTNGALGTLANNGLKATLAGTAVRQILIQLSAPSTKAAEALSKLGLSLEDVDPSRIGLIAALRNLAAVELDVGAASDLVGNRAAGALLILREQVDAVEELTQANQTFRGEAEQVATTMDKSLSAAAAKFGSAVTELTLQVGDDGLTGVLKGTLDSLTNVARALGGQAVPEFGAAEVVVLGLATALGAAGLAGALRLAAVGFTALVSASPFGLFITGAAAIAGVVISLTELERQADPATIALENQSKALKTIAEEANKARDAVREFARTGNIEAETSNLRTQLTAARSGQFELGRQREAGATEIAFSNAVGAGVSAKEIAGAFQRALEQRRVENSFSSIARTRPAGELATENEGIKRELEDLEKNLFLANHGFDAQLTNQLQTGVLAQKLTLGIQDAQQDLGISTRALAETLREKEEFLRSELPFRPIVSGIEGPPIPEGVRNPVTVPLPPSELIGPPVIPAAERFAAAAEANARALRGAAKAAEDSISPFEQLTRSLREDAVAAAAATGTITETVRTLADEGGEAFAVGLIAAVRNKDEELADVLIAGAQRAAQERRQLTEDEVELLASLRAEIGSEAVTRSNIIPAAERFRTPAEVAEDTAERFGRSFASIAFDNLEQGLVTQDWQAVGESILRQIASASFEASTASLGELVAQGVAGFVSNIFGSGQGATGTGAGSRSPTGVPPLQPPFVGPLPPNHTGPPGAPQTPTGQRTAPGDTFFVNVHVRDPEEATLAGLQAAQDARQSLRAG